MKSITDLLDRCITERESLLDERHETALRLFNGFREGCPELVLDLFARTLVINNYSDPAEEGLAVVRESCEHVLKHFDWLRAVLLKSRNSASPLERQGRLLAGSDPDRKIKEQGVWYAIDLTLNQDASFYLDTRNLRHWALTNLKGKTVLNAFAYTGSLGVAATASGTKRVVQLDRTRRFLNLAKDSYSLNGFPVNRQDFISEDFWVQTSRMRRAGTLFDCVILDPPFFATSSKGRVDQAHNSLQLINKVRPLVQDHGWLVTVNNALYVSGQSYMSVLESLCLDGYIRIAEIIPVPPDVTGYPGTVSGSPITDPSPFNHSTKIALLEVRRKSA